MAKNAETLLDLNKEIKRIKNNWNAYNYHLEQLNLLDNITCKFMMGEYLLYYNGILFGGIYDDRLLVKIVDSNKKYNMQESIPYESAKPMYLVDDVDDQEVLRNIVLDTCKDLKK